MSSGGYRFLAEFTPTVWVCPILMDSGSPSFGLLECLSVQGFMCTVFPFTEKT